MIIIYIYAYLGIYHGYPVTGSIGSGQFKYYHIPFESRGVTIEVEVFRGEVWCYSSDTNYNPNSRNYLWRLFISMYNDTYVNPRFLRRAPGTTLFISILGVNINNDFRLNTMIGDTSTTCEC